MKNLKAYFESTEGFGILATADSSGKVDAAVYSRPHFLEEGTLAFIMRDRLTHHNLQSNPHATFLFREDGPGYKGKRLFLKKVREENNEVYGGILLPIMWPWLKDQGFEAFGMMNRALKKTAEHSCESSF